MKDHEVPCRLALLDKPRGPSSHRALAPLKRRAGTSRAGHAGTLDPGATGLLVAATGRATRLLPFAETFCKEYLVALRLGVRTDTLDMDGRILTVVPPPDPGSIDWDRLVAPQLGAIDQVPPAYSAISVNGKRSHDLARRGESPDLPARRVVIDAVVQMPGADLLRSTGREIGDPLLRVTCGKGTYVRSLVRDLGDALGCGASVSALRRTRIGPWTLPDEAPSEWTDPDLMSAAEAFPDWPRKVVNDHDRSHLAAGKFLDWSEADASPALIVDDQGTCLAWGRAEQGRFYPEGLLDLTARG